ncbi:MAG: WcaI family glycosyltransferase [Candidatus Acidiferrales bacterium]
MTSTVATAIHLPRAAAGRTATRKLHILIVTGSYAPDSTGIAPLNTELCEYLVATGHRVTVATGLPHYPEWRVPASYRGRFAFREQRSGVDVRRHWIWVPAHRTPVRRIVFDTSVGVAAGLSGAAVAGVDIVLGISPPLQAGFAAWAIAKSRGVPFVLQIKDLVPDLAVSLGMMRNRVAIGFARSLERFLYRRADGILVICDGFREHVVRAGVTANRIAVVPDWVDTRFIHPDAAGEEFRRVHNLNGDFTVLHIGNMGTKQKLAVALEAAAILGAAHGITICLAGDGADRARLESLARSRNLSNVRFLPLASRADLPGMLAAADLLLLSQSAAVSDSVIPSKLLTYLASGRPIIAAAHRRSQAAQTVERSGGGLIVPPEDATSLAEAILRLREDSGERAKLARHGRAFAEEHFASDRVLARLENFLAMSAERGAPRESHA